MNRKKPKYAVLGGKKIRMCEAEGCKMPHFAGGYCRWQSHQALRTDAKYLKQQAAKDAKPKKVYEIPMFSPKYAKEVARYNRRTPGWKLENPICAVPGCGLPTVDRHHDIGRGIHLNDESTHIPLCFEHHRICKESPKEAEKLGIIRTRTIVRKK